MGYACSQVWTFKNRVAFVLSVTDKGQPVRDGIKLQRLKQLLRTMMDKHGNGVVNIKTVQFFISSSLNQMLLAALCGAPILTTTGMLLFNSCANAGAV
jgi:hypothetical protein